MINLFKKKKLIVTHDGGFHADDVFACAVLENFLDKEGLGYEVVRTRDEKTIERADYVFDVGGVYDAEKNRFDHHQKGRAGERENKILYAAAGLVWKHFGEKLTSKEVVEILDKRIFAPLDAADNGQDLSKSLFGDIFPYSAPSIIGVFNSSWKETNRPQDKEFFKMVKLAKVLIKREIEQAEIALASEAEIKSIYEKSTDKKIIILEKPFSRQEILRALVDFTDPIYFIYPKSDDSGWKIETMRKTVESFEPRKPFPESWRGLRESDLEKASGVPGAWFAHDGRFYVVAKTREAAIALAKLALES